MEEMMVFSVTELKSVMVMELAHLTREILALVAQISVMKMTRDVTLVTLKVPEEMETRPSLRLFLDLWWHL